MNRSLASPAFAFEESDEPRQSLQIDQIQDRRIYRLPRRDLSSASKHGWGAVASALFGTALGLWWMAGTAFPELWNNNAPNWGMVALGSLGLVFIVPAIAIGFCGVMILTNQTYCTIELDQDGLVSSDRIGIFSWSRERHPATITHLRIAKGGREPVALLNDSGLALTNWLRNWKYSLVAETSDGRTYPVAAGYEREVLMEVARDLAPRLNSQSTWIAPRIERPGSGSPGRERIGAIELVDDERLPKVNEIDPAVPKPATTEVTIERRSDGVTVLVPPIGYTGNLLCVAFCVVWNGFVVLAACIYANSGLLGALLVLPHALIGIGVALGTIHLSKRKTILATAGGQLLITASSPIRTKKKEWSRDRIHEIKVGKANVDSELSVMDLQIHSVGEPKFNCLWERPTEELEWIASELRHALQIIPGVNASFAESDAGGRPMPLTKSQLSVQYTTDASDADSVTITVPQRGFRRYLPGVLAGIACLLASIPFYVFAAKAGIAERFVGDFSLGWALILSALGSAFIFHFLSQARTRFWIHADNQRLQVRHDGLLKTTQVTYVRQELGPLRISESSVAVGKGYQSEIVVRPGDPDSATLMRGFEHDDLVFVVDAINRTMNLE